MTRLPFLSKPKPSEAVSVWFFIVVSIRDEAVFLYPSQVDLVDDVRISTAQGESRWLQRVLSR